MNNHNDEPWRPSRPHQAWVWSRVSSLVLLLFGDIITNGGHIANVVRTKSQGSLSLHRTRRWAVSFFTYFPNILILLWLQTLVWGEYGSFNKSIKSCDWSNWETWPSEATPHHLVFVADPQLVDPHTYPGRPWPLSTFTVKHTDLYLRRAYSRIQRNLDPSTIFFLGDLFDGGREWSTSTSESPEEQYRGYGTLFWQKEFDRFSSIFLREWKAEKAGINNALGERRVIASLPGNHDLGFGKGIQKPVRDRFQAFFGDGNRIDIIGNHTFVSMDAVSLSAKEQEGLDSIQELYQPSFDFLDNVKTRRAQMLRDDFHPTGSITEQHEHDIDIITYPGVEQGRQHDRASLYPSPDNKADKRNLDDGAVNSLNTRDLLPPIPDYPTVLLTHVPLYRAPDTSCGPLREKGNAISVSGGYQYQNVLSETLSSHVFSKLTTSGSGDLDYVFSGDDHDYCELIHHFPFHYVQEITVKSISWAMGVRHPGFVMASLWNPVDQQGKRLTGHLKPLSEEDKERNPHDPRTMQTHLCLLPDQLGIFIRYGLLFGLTITLLLVRAILAVFMATRASPAEDRVSFLPKLYFFPSMADRAGGITGNRVRSQSSAEREKGLPYTNGDSDHARLMTSSSSTSSASRSTPIKARGGNAPIPLVLPSYAYGHGDAENGHQKAAAPGLQSKLKSVGMEWAWTLWYVARVAFLWYFFLLGH